MKKFLGFLTVFGLVLVLGTSPALADVPPPVCGDDVVNQASEECDGPDNANCDGQCLPPGDPNECVCARICGDDVVNQMGEECDGTDDTNCPGECDMMCICPTQVGACCTNGPGTASECIITTQQDCETNHSLYVGDGTQCTAKTDCVFLLVTMESMSARATSKGVLLSWTTATEVDTVGFRLLRETPGGREKALEVIAPMIPASGDGLTGGTYEFLDNTLRTGVEKQYYIEDIDIYGKATRHGPIVVERVAPTHFNGNQRVVPKR